MSTENFRELPDPEDFPLVDGNPSDEDVTLLRDATDEALTVESEVTAEDLSSDDLINNGALPEDLELDKSGIREVDADLADPSREDTIDERIRQEEPDVDEIAAAEDASLEAEALDDPLA